MQGNFRFLLEFFPSVSPPRDLILISNHSWETGSTQGTIQQETHFLGDSGGSRTLGR